MKLVDPWQNDEEQGDGCILASGCGFLACLILFAMFAIIIWRATQ